jgi:hypothetical protein
MTSKKHDACGLEMVLEAANHAVEPSDGSPRTLLPNPMR